MIPAAPRTSFSAAMASRKRVRLCIKSAVSSSAKPCSMAKSSKCSRSSFGPRLLFHDVPGLLLPPLICDKLFAASFTSPWASTTASFSKVAFFADSLSKTAFALPVMMPTTASSAMPSLAKPFSSAAERSAKSLRKPDTNEAGRSSLRS